VRERQRERERERVGSKLCKIKSFLEYVLDCILCVVGFQVEEEREKGHHGNYRRKMILSRQFAIWGKKKWAISFIVFRGRCTYTHRYKYTNTQTTNYTLHIQNPDGDGDKHSVLIRK
jgi:hypothetical protein